MDTSTETAEDYQYQKNKIFEKKLLNAYKFTKKLLFLLKNLSKLGLKHRFIAFGLRHTSVTPSY